MSTMFTIMGFILANTVVLALHHHQIDPQFKKVLDVLNLVNYLITNCFAIEGWQWWGPENNNHSFLIIIHQTHYEKSDWSRAFNQFTIACELDMINAISAADIAFIMWSSTSAWLLSPLECSPQKRMAKRFASVSEDELCEKCIIKQLFNSVFAWYHELSKPRVCVICLSLRLRQITQTSVLIIHDIILNLIQ